MTGVRPTVGTVENMGAAMVATGAAMVDMEEEAGIMVRVMGAGDTVVTDLLMAMGAIGQATVMTMIIDPVTALGMATAMADMGTTTNQVGTTAKVVMGVIAHMTVVIAEEVIMVKAMGVIAPIKVEVMEDMVVMAVTVFWILVIRVDGGDCAVIFLSIDNCNKN